MISLLKGKTTTGAGTEVNIDNVVPATQQKRARSLGATITGTGAVTATVYYQARLGDNHGWVTVATLTLSGTNTDSELVAVDGPYPRVRGYLYAVSGTGAKVDLDMQL